MTDDVHRRGRAGERQAQRELDGDRRADVHVLLQPLEALRLDADVIRIRRKVSKDEASGFIRRRGAATDRP